ncbi:bifunctional DNA primase/polymerase [Streptomyces roseus]|uniref:DNA primase n=1 Tax=Streptomyces roseus TaxID=66430 RepID=A0A0J6XNY7_9ACTN|nr:bifunctional DNA primase/polymerase [Streptomyces roseus]KMO97865.1 DNA primase [Streptomyces roseus]
MTYQPASALLTAALDAAALGWSVFPLRPGQKRPALHGQEHCPGLGDCAGGHRKWEVRATSDPDRIRRAWDRLPFNVGIATGPSNLVVVDLDMPKSKGSSEAPRGTDTFQALCERAGQPIPATLSVRTPTGGSHLYFTAPAGVRLGNSAGRLGPLIDTRAWGGYVVAPGSVTATGTYEVSSPLTPAPFPTWLYSLLAPRQVLRQLTGRPTLAQRTGRYAAAALNAETASVESAPAGERNGTLLRAARALGRFIAAGDLPRDVVEEALQGAGESAGLPSSECRTTIRSGLNWSIARNAMRQPA